MALKIKIAETKVVLLKLLICVIIFYLVYYVVLCICFTTFRLQMLDGLAPFDFKTKPSWINTYYLVLLVSLEITYFISGLLFVLVVEEWVWDYAITVTVIHIAVTSAGLGLISMICGGQCLAYYLFRDNFIYPILDDF
ncbi:putative transmembrane protein 244 isoform X2 [Anolis carolinensis]|uniref:putative transmembrane protein 244 isoform X2 n=1 Tax=Anolis carolinensis TaxID=28377 RepID=UPI002F2B9077